MSQLLPAIQLVVTLLCAGLVVVGWRHWFRPGGRAFAGLAAAITALSTSYLILLARPGSPALLVATENARDAAFTALPVLWLLFALEYTGRGRLATPRTLAGLLSVPAVTLTLLAVPGLGHLYWGAQLETLASGPVELSGPFGPWYWVNLGYGYLLMAAGIALLLGLVLSENRLYTDQSVAIVVGAVVPLAANGLVQVDAGPTALPLQPASFLVTGAAFGFALFRFELFALLPATRQIGRDAAVADLDEGMVIVDDGGQIVDVNRAAAAVFGRAPDDLVGTALGRALDEPPPADRLAPPAIETDDGRVFDVTVSGVQDHDGRDIGHAVVFRDVTDRELRETQLEVLNRVLRHNLRNKVHVVHGHTDRLADEVSDEVADSVERIATASESLAALGERARELDRIERREHADPEAVAVAALLDRIAADLVDARPACDVAVTVPDDLTVVSYPRALEVVLANLLSNAVEHADEPITATATPTPDGAVIEIRDRGPGIPAHELAVLDAGSETPLEHGSGLGLWIARWGVTYVGGDLSFAANDPRGTVARVEVPDLRAPGAALDVRDA